MLVFLVRHAQAIPRGSWDADDLDRPLNAKGHKQAPQIAASIRARLDGATVRLVSSPALRCVQTIEPLAEALGVPIATEDRLVEVGHVDAAQRPSRSARAAWLGGRSIDVLSKYVSTLKEKGAIVLCTHGELVSPTLERICPDPTEAFSDDKNQKGSYWALRLKGGRCTRAEYVPAP